MRRNVPATISLLLSVLALSCSRSPAPQPSTSNADVVAPSPSPSAASSAHVSGSGQHVNIRVTQDGFVAEQGQVAVGQPVTLVVTRMVERTCATDILIDEYGIRQALPLNQPVEVTFTPTKARDIQFSCAMHMISGKLTAN